MEELSENLGLEINLYLSGRNPRGCLVTPPPMAESSIDNDPGKKLSYLTSNYLTYELELFHKPRVQGLARTPSPLKDCAS